MKAAIIAAGKGERLFGGGISVPKPLVPIAGEPLIARAIRAAAGLDVTSVACIVNDIYPEVADYLEDTRWPVPVETVVKTTPSSMESLFGLAPLLAGEPFVLFTVDAVFLPGTLEPFVATAETFKDALGALALTHLVDDEKPLWVRTDEDNRIIAIGDSAVPSSLITAGFYYFRPEIFGFMATARALKFTALRHFLGLLARCDKPLYGIPVAPTIDVDFPEDIEKAEDFLRNTP
jgi:NDP-sugar pyrophosphorylase family protein